LPTVSMPHFPLKVRLPKSERGSGLERTASILRCCRKQIKTSKQLGERPRKSSWKGGSTLRKIGDQDRSEPSDVRRYSGCLARDEPISQRRSAQEVRETSASESRAVFPGKLEGKLPSRDGDTRGTDTVKGVTKKEKVDGRRCDRSKFV
jgi:hypothetical protein